MKGWTQQAGITVLWSVTVYALAVCKSGERNIFILKNSGDSVLLLGLLFWEGAFAIVL